MKIDKHIGDSEYVCSEEDCMFHWRFQDGYFQLKDGKPFYSAESCQFLKPALVREHGYLYIAEVEGSPQMRTWRCAVTDCPNTIVDEV
jgi:hypothetical protein